MIKNSILIIGAFLLVSCNSNVVYNSFKSIDNQQWSFDNKIEFIVNNQDTISPKNMFINIRNNTNYEFSSLFLIAKIEFPKGLKVIDTLEYEMTDETGQWLGTGFTEVKENKLYYKENVVFSEIGDYKISIQQATRSIKDIDGEIPLKGITDVGISIEKVNK